MSGIRRVSDLGTNGVQTIVDGSVSSVDLATNIALTGTPTAPTATTGTNTTQLATTAFVGSAVGNSVTSLSGTASQITVSALTGAVTLSFPTNVILAGSVTAYTPTLPIKLGAWTTASTYTGVEANKGYLLVGNTIADPHLYLRTNSAAGTVRIGGNGNNTLTVSDTTVICGGFISSAFQTGVTYGSYGSASFLSANNNYVGFAYAPYSCAWMMNNDTFGHFRSNSFWNFYVQNGSFFSSDERWKRNIAPIKYGMDFVNALLPVEYQRLTDQTDDPDETLEPDIYLGFTTQQVFRALDEIKEDRTLKMVNIGGANTSEGQTTDRQYLNSNEMIAPMVKALQELDVRLKTLEGVI